MFLQKTNVKEILWKTITIQMVFIFIPLIFFGAIGWFIDTLRNSGHTFLWIGIGVAFFVTHVFLYFQFRKFSFEIKKFSSRKDQKKENISDKNY